MATMDKRKHQGLLPHERKLLKRGALRKVAQTKTSILIWLHSSPASKYYKSEYFDGDSAAIEDEDPLARCLCYRHMLAKELRYLIKHNQLPSLEPYQALTRGEQGRSYCEAFLQSCQFKRFDTTLSAVVEFNCDMNLADRLFDSNSKVEADGETISHGLGFRASRTLPKFNQTLFSGDTTWRIVFVKRQRKP